MDTPKTLEQLQEELNTANKKIEEQNQVVTDLKGKLKAEKAIEKKGFPKVKIGADDYNITIQKAHYRDGDNNRVITADDIKNEDGLAEKLLEMKFGGLVKIVTAAKK